MNGTEQKAAAQVETSDSTIALKVGGSWRLTGNLPSLKIMPAEVKGGSVRVVPDQLQNWDSSLPAFLLRVRNWCRERQVSFDMAALPRELRDLFQLISDSEKDKSGEKAERKTTRKNEGMMRRALYHFTGAVRFVGDCAIAVVETPAHPRRFSWRDFVAEMAGAGPKALPIIGFLSFLIGMTFAFQTSVQLRRFGADAFVVQAVGVAVLRQLAPLIAAMVLAGRTGAAFAARIADMKLGGELDALNLAGVSPVQYIVLPRVAALMLMTPLVTLYADFLGILGGMLMTTSKLNLPIMGFWVHLQSTVTLRDLEVGIIKSVVFGTAVALAGTLCGLQSERSSVGVGRAVTSAVVAGISVIVAVDAIFAPILRDLNF